MKYFFSQFICDIYSVKFQIPLKAENADENTADDDDDDEDDDKNDDPEDDFDHENTAEKSTEETIKPTVITETPDVYQKDEKKAEKPENVSLSERREKKQDNKDIVIEDTIYRDDYDYNPPDDELEKKEDTFEGSGGGISFG